MEPVLINESNLVQGDLSDLSILIKRMSSPRKEDSKPTSSTLKSPSDGDGKSSKLESSTKVRVHRDTGLPLLCDGVSNNLLQLRSVYDSFFRKFRKFGQWNDADEAKRIVFKFPKVTVTEEEKVYFELDEAGAKILLETRIKSMHREDIESKKAMLDQIQIILEHCCSPELQEKLKSSKVYKDNVDPTAKAPSPLEVWTY